MDLIQLEKLIRAALAEDIGEGDHSTRCCIPAGVEGRGVLKIKEEGILAGMEVAEFIFRMADPHCEFTAYKKDGDEMHAGEIAFRVKTDTRVLLECERVVLNCMQRMSGIATLTRKYVNKLSGYHTRVLDTRKTTPNFRLLEKEAVHIGGGVNHRMGLYDMIMLKDNHIDHCGSLEKAIDLAYEYVQTTKPGLKIEVETRNLDEVRRVVANGKADRIMLDNFQPDMIREALLIIRQSMETEASGGINLTNVEDYAKTGVDFVSVGALIHQAVSLDLSLKAEK
jgi:nicotinate-nucleotide pyrophosphorylase (carboxylating)